MKNISYLKKLRAWDIRKSLFSSKKLFALCFLSGSMFCSSIYANNFNLHITKKSATVQEIIQEIEQQTKLLFIYDKQELNTNKLISVNNNCKTLDDALNEILKGSNLSYVVEGNNIILTKNLKTQSLDQAIEQKKITVTGTILDDAGLPIIGATVMEEGTTNGTITDIDGNYSISVQKNAKLTFSYIGYNKQSISVNGKTSINISMKEDLRQLEEVVVVGYGTQKKGSITGAVSGIETQDIVKAPTTDISTSLGGKLPGLRVVTRSGEPGNSGAEVDIRGFGKALVIVDGVPSSFEQIDPNEIENISILKDASAAVYGVQAANGVILVTTKRGKDGKTKVNFNSTFNWQRPTIYPKMVNAAQFIELTDEDKVNRGEAPIYGPEELAKWKAGGPGYESTDWYGQTVRSWAPMQQYNVNARGGNEKLSFFSSLGYVNQEGMWKSKSLNFDRFNFRTNVDAKITDDFSASVSLSGRKEKRDAPSTDMNLTMASLQRVHPTHQPYVNGNKDYLSEVNVPFFNPLAQTDKSVVGYNKSTWEVFEGSLTLNYDASRYVKGLSAKVLGYYNSTNYLGTVFNKQFNLYKYDEAKEEYYPSYKGNDPSNIQKTNDKYENKVFQGSINYNNTFAQKHDVSALFLIETRQNKSSWFNAYREFAIDAIDELGSGVDENKNNNGSSGYSGNIGYIGRLNYGYDNRYLAEVSFRYDGSSKFPSGSRWGFFPSVSAGWRISEESFIKDNFDFIDNLKLRASWGKLGDDADASGFQYLTGYNYPNGKYIFGDKVVPTLVSKGLANPDITWYKSTLYNVGVELSLWNGLLSTEFDVFYRKRTDLLATRAASLPGTFGASLPKENLNSDSDRGFELVLSHRNNLDNGINYSITSNVSYTRSKYNHVERNASVNQYQDWRNNTNNRWKNIHWGYKSIGQFQSYDEIATAPVQDGKGNTTLNPGDIRYKDYNGDGVIDDTDKHIIGRGSKPEIMYGIDLFAQWKGVDVSVFMQGAANFNVYLQDQMTQPLFNGESTIKDMMNRWHHEDPYDSTSRWIPGKHPSTYASGKENNKLYSSHWLQNASYLRIKEIQVGYTLPKEILHKAGIENLRVFVSGYNLFTFTGMKLLDPETASTNGRYYPQQKVLSAGLNLTF